MTVDQPESVVESTDESLNDDVVTRLEKSFDSRFSGFQGVLDKALNTMRGEFAAQLEEVKRDRLSPEERADLEETEREREYTKLKRENELLRLRKEYPDEVDFLDSWLEKDNFTDQLSLLKQFRSRSQQTEATPREDSDEGADAQPVDRNNPPRRGQDSLADLVRSAGGTMTREQAHKLLEATNERGILSRLRRQE